MDYITIATNEIYLRLANKLKIQLPSLRILTLSDCCEEYQSDPFVASRWLKTNLYKFCKTKTLYLDADVKIAKSIAELKLLKPISMALAFYPTVSECQHISLNELKYTLDFVPANHHQYNSGVMLIDHLSCDLFKHWHNEWLIFKKHDQLALVRAVYKNKLTVKLLAQKYNEPNSRVSTDSVIIHYSGDNKHLIL